MAISRFVPNNSNAPLICSIGYGLELVCKVHMAKNLKALVELLVINKPIIDELHRSGPLICVSLYVVRSDLTTSHSQNFVVHRQRFKQCDRIRRCRSPWIITYRCSPTGSLPTSTSNCTNSNNSTSWRSTTIINSNNTLVRARARSPRPITHRRINITSRRRRSS